MTKSPFSPLYVLMEILSGLALIGIAGVILADVGLRFVGGQVPASDDFSGYGLVAVLFLGLAPAYRRGEHIRVGLLVDRLGGPVRHGLEVVLLGLATVGITWAAFWSGRLAYDSWRFHDVAQGLVPVPLWMPQLSMVVGLTVFALALAEDLLRAAKGGTPSHLAQAALAADAAPTFER
ncbi:TRAP transporter small permease [Prosthecomicrobium sp. N25]|uniref:TRAP transporter small permease n=1 Tax=Prosthecomicrobium sp. N25 TaxID=3129254 RepID=UPI0030786337